MNELPKAALDIILSMKPWPDGWTLYPTNKPGEPTKRYITRITRTRDGGLQIDGTAGSRHYLYYSRRDAERLYNQEALRKSA